MARSVDDHKDILLKWMRAKYHREDAATQNNIAYTTFRRWLKPAIAWSEHAPDGRQWAEGIGLDPYASSAAIASPVAPDIQNKVLLDKIKRLQRELDIAHRENVNADSVRQGIFELANHAPGEPDWTNDSKQFPYHHGIPGLLLSDIHFGEKVFSDQIFHVNDFNTEICHKRLRRVFDTTIHLTHNVLANPLYPGFVLKLAGDNINGIIHEELELGADKRFMEQIIEAADAIHAGILKLAKVYGRVYIVGVPGNHGRITRKPMAKFNASTNADWLIYQMLERFLLPLVANGSVVFNCPPSRDVTYKVAGRRFRLTHGDQFRGGDGMIGFLGPVTRGKHKKLSMAMSLPTDDEQFDTLELGHFHSLHMTHNLIVNGSIKGYDEYALSNSFIYEPPQQALYLTHEKYGINHYMPVLADERSDLEHNPAWVEWKKQDINPLTRFLDGMEWAAKVA